MIEYHYTRSQQASDNAARNAWFLKVNGREMTWMDVVLSWGGRFAGQSQDTLHRNRASRSEDDGIKEQTNGS